MKMHWCSAKVNLSGQNLHIVHFLPTTAISWPEAQVLSALHGDENVYDIQPCFVSETRKEDEKNRLLAKYGLIVEQVFPGRSFQMEMLMPGEPEGQPLADEHGAVVASEPVPGGPDEPPDTPAPEPDTHAVFKPTRHQPPHRGA